MKRVIGQRGKKNFFLHFYAFQSILSRLRHTLFSKIFVSAKRETCASAKRVMGQRGKKNFFLHVYVFQSILNRLRHTFFFENFCEREARSAKHMRGSLFIQTLHDKQLRSQEVAWWPW